MNVFRRSAHLPSVLVARLVGAALSVAVAVALFTRFGINSSLSRDEAIYAYGGQQLAHGVAPYVGIFDAKGPMATWVAGAAAAAAHALGRNDLYAIRVTYFVLSCLTVLAVYLLAARLWRSAVAGLVAAVVFASFRGFAADALSGPDAKTPGIFLAVLSMWFLTRRQWFWGTLAASVAFLVWQPLALYAVIAVGVALLNATPGRRWRALASAVAGGATPLVLTLVYFAAAGAMAEFVDAAVMFPLRGVVRTSETVPARLERITAVVRDQYLFSGPIFWAGLVALLLLVVALLVRGRRDLLGTVRHPLVCVVLTTLVAQAAYAATDFQGYPDLYPLLPYPALGLAGLVAAALQVARRDAARRVTAVAALVALAVLTAFAWTRFTDDPLHDGGLRAQRAEACGVERMLAAGGSLYAMGDPTSLVVTHRRNPDRFVYMDSGVDRWKLRGLHGRFDDWARQVQDAAPRVIVLSGWHSHVKTVMQLWLRASGYRTAFLGTWRVYVMPSVFKDAKRQGVRLTRRPTDLPTGPGGRALPAFHCPQERAPSAAAG